MARDWSAFHEKITEEGCRVCGQRPVDPAHVVPRSRVKHGGEHADNCVPLCRAHHRAYDDGTLELLPHLTLGEQTKAVELAGGIIGAIRYVSPPVYKLTRAA